ncbi:MAG: gluconokinase [Gammaproteobacteria bacterium]|nr:gluconokinase [Gammaproteobacteria bacterium]
MTLVSGSAVSEHIAVVMGVCGCGKTTLGEALAERLRVPFLEGDDYHPRANIDKMSAGVPLADEDRWPWLDALGRALAASAREHGGVVGACSALRRAYREHLEIAAGLPVRFVCLTGARDDIALRMGTRRDHFMPASLLDSQLEILEVPAPDERAIVLSATAPLADTVQRTVQFLSAESQP